MLLIICGLLLSVFASATTPRPIPLNQQIREADGVFIGHYLRKKSVELENGKIATQMVFKMTKEHGLQSELFGMDEVIVHYPGGNLKGRTINFDHVPQFVIGEKVVIFIKSLDSRYWGMNQGFGSFRVINYGPESMMINYAFPDHVRFGQTKMTDFEVLFKTIKGSNLKSVYAVIDDEEHMLDNAPLRAPASSAEELIKREVASEQEDSEHNENPSHLSMLWLAGVLSFLGGIFRVRRQGSIK